MNAWNEYNDLNGTDAYDAWLQKRSSIAIIGKGSRTTLRCHPQATKSPVINFEGVEGNGEAEHHRESWDSEDTIKEETHIDNEDATLHLAPCPSLPSTCDEYVSPTTIRGTKSNPFVRSGESLRNSKWATSKYPNSRAILQRDPTNKLDMDDDDDDDAAITAFARPATLSQRRIVAKLANLNSCIAGDLPDDQVFTDRVTEDHESLELQYEDQAPEHIPRTQLAAENNSGEAESILQHENLKEADTDVLVSSDEADEATLESNTADDIKECSCLTTDDIIKARNLELRDLKSELNPRARPWHMPDRVDSLELDTQSASSTKEEQGDSMVGQSVHRHKTVSTEPIEPSRTLSLHGLPKNADYYLVQSLIHGGSIETMVVTGTSAVVTFTEREACQRYLEAHPHAIEYKHKNRIMTATIEASSEREEDNPLLQGQLSAGATRVVRVTGVDHDLTIKDLHNLAAGSLHERQIETVMDKLRSGVRSTVFRFANVRDSVGFKNDLTQDEEIWGDGNIRWIEDPCERAVNVHLD